MSRTQASAAAPKPATQPILVAADSPPISIPPYTGPRSREPRERIILMVPPLLKRAVQDLALREGRTDNSMTELLVRRGLESWPQREIISNAAV